MTVKEHLESTYDGENEYNRRKKAECVDGFSVSIQGGTGYHYCDPRKLCNEYNEVELGFPSESIPDLNEYAEDENNHTQTVFGYVPIELVESLVKQHGGIKPV